MKIEEKKKSCGAHTPSEHAESLAAAQGTSICQPSWGVTKWIMRNRATVHRGHQETPRALTRQVTGENEDGADVSHHPKPRGSAGRRDSGPCREMHPPSRPAATHRAALQLCSRSRTTQCLRSAFLSTVCARTHTRRREEKGSFVTETTAG